MSWTGCTKCRRDGVVAAAVIAADVWLCIECFDASLVRLKLDPEHERKVRATCTDPALIARRVPAKPDPIDIIRRDYEVRQRQNALRRERLEEREARHDEDPERQPYETVYHAVARGLARIRRRRMTFDDYIESMFQRCRDRPQALPSKMLSARAQRIDARHIEELGPLFPEAIEQGIVPTVQFTDDYNARQPRPDLTICDCGWQGEPSDDCPVCGDPFWRVDLSARVLRGERRSWSARGRMDRWIV